MYHSQQIIVNVRGRLSYGARCSGISGRQNSLQGPQPSNRGPSLGISLLVILVGSRPGGRSDGLRSSDGSRPSAWRIGHQRTELFNRGPA